jgi:hypothetical protein
MLLSLLGSPAYKRSQARAAAGAGGAYGDDGEETPEFGTSVYFTTPDPAAEEPLLLLGAGGGGGGQALRGSNVTLVEGLRQAGGAVCTPLGFGLLLFALLGVVIGVLGVLVTAGVKI